MWEERGSMGGGKCRRGVCKCDGGRGGGGGGGLSVHS